MTFPLILALWASNTETSTQQLPRQQQPTHLATHSPLNETTLSDHDKAATLCALHNVVKKKLH
jgi:hypothetical protein